MQGADEFNPIIINLGKVKRRRAKSLKKGRGALMGDVQGVIEEVRHGLGPAADDVKLVPVVMIYKEKKRKKKRSRMGLFGF